MLASSVWRGVILHWFIGGLFIGAAITATMAVLIGSLVQPLFPAGLEVLALGLLGGSVFLAEVGVYQLRLPQANRQVRQWVASEGSPGAFQFGVEMGTGLRTFSTSNLPHVALLAVLLHPDPTTALIAAVGFASGRSMMTVSRLRSGDAEAWDTDWHESERRIRQILTLAVALALWVALGGRS